MSEKLSFVTGGTGLLGSHVLLLLAKEGKVRALKRINSSLQQVVHLFDVYEASSLLENIEWVEGDLLHYSSLEEATKNVDVVYHCAALVSFHEKDYEKLIELNVNGTTNLLEASKRNEVSKLCHVSSVASLNSYSNASSISESASWKNDPQNSVYAISKYLSEMEVWRAGEEGLDHVIVNPSVIVGASALASGSSNMLHRASKGSKFYTQGATGFIAATDAAALMIKLAASSISKERYVLNSANLSYKEFFSLANAAFKKSEPSIAISPWATELAWRLLSLIPFISPQINRAIARASQSKKGYDGNKIADLLNYNYEPIETTIKQAAQHLEPKA